tara:strand:+ start:1546 stop:2019 length:474 start_codon:yes stop_codon:yes gene_type:complete
MKNTLILIITLFYCSTFILGQSVSSSDSLKVITANKLLFSAIENNDLEIIKALSTDKIYCMICFDSTDFSQSPYMLEKIDFINNHLPSIKKNPLYHRAIQSNELLLINEYERRKGITAFWAIYQKNELSPGHEGGQFGVFFRQVNGELKFAGLETIP